MSRLTHSLLGYVRSLQISEHNLFVFVEGQIHDPYFYDKLCKHVCKSTIAKHVILSANQLPGDTGGKNQLISFFEFLKDNSLLTVDFLGNKKAFVFFMDKDIDDFLKRQINSPHVIYTKYYTIENHLFADGDLLEAVAAASSLSLSSVTEIIGDCEDWRKAVALSWKDWVKVCLYARKHEINCECNFKTQSRINKPLFKASIDDKKYSEYCSLLQKHSGFSNETFQEQFEEISSTVEELFHQGKYDLLFQGKWYSHFMVEEIKSVKGNVNGLHGKIESALLITLDFRKPWSNNLKKPLKRVINALN
jgi:beta-galactosidase beta subunit